MLVSLSTELFDIDGDFVFDSVPDDTEMDNFTRRLSRIKTLDGGVAMNDFGYSPGDRTIILAVAGLDAAAIAVISRVIQQHKSFIVCGINGAFSSGISGVAYSGGVLKITCLISGVRS